MCIFENSLIEKYTENSLSIKENQEDVMTLISSINVNSIKLENILKGHNLKSLMKKTKSIRKQLDMIETRFKREVTPEM